MARTVDTNSTFENWRQNYNSLATDVGNKDALTTADKSSVVNAINYIMDQYFYFQDFDYDGSDGATSNTVFSGADNAGNTLAYSAGKILVFKNGALLRSGTDYTANNGTSVTLASSANNGDVIRFSVFTGSYENVGSAGSSVAGQWTLAGGTIYNHNTGGIVINADSSITTTTTVSDSIQLQGETYANGSIYLNAQNDLRLQDSDSSHYAAIQAPATISANYTLTLPADDGTSGQTLQTDGNGVLTWASAGTAPDITISANNTANETVYPVFVDGATGAQGLESDTGLTYNPSTGLLSTTLLAGTVSTATQNTITTMTGLVTVGTIGTGTWQGTAIARAYIANDAIDGTKIADDAVDSEHIADDAVDSEHIAADALNSASFFAKVGEVQLGSLDPSMIQISSESFADNDTSLMTSAAIQDKILGYSYSTTTGTLTPTGTVNANEYARFTGATTLEARTGAEVRSDIGAGTSNLAVGTGSGDAHRGDHGVTAYNHSQAAHAPSGAEANVQSDWNAGSGDAHILNKPSLLALGSSSSTAHRGDHGATAYTHSQATHAPSNANNYSHPNHSGHVTSSGDGATTIASGVVTSAMIVDGTIVAGDLAADCITAAKIGDDVINSEHIVADSIDAEHLAPNSVNTDAIINDAVRTAHIQDGNVTAAKIPSSAALSIASLTATGDITSNTSSDMALKENIINIPNPLEKISKIGGYMFDWKDHGYEDVHGKGHDTGIIAQEIEAILPEIVNTRETGIKGVNYMKLIPLLVESIKELKTELDELKSSNS